MREREGEKEGQPKEISGIKERGRERDGMKGTYLHTERCRERDRGRERKRERKRKREREGER